MAIPFLSNIDLNRNQALQLVLHNATSDPSPAVEGQLYWNSSENRAYAYDGSAWINLGGDITRVNITAGNGLSGTSVDTTSGDHTQTLAVGGGDGITVASDKISVTVDDSTIELSASDNSGAVRIKNSGVTTTKIADDAVTTAKILDANVTTAKIANVNVTTGKIANGAVTTAKIAADAVDGTKIADDAINSEHITDGSVDNVHLANSSVTIGGTAVSLGGTITALTALTDIDVTAGNKTILDGVGANNLTIGAGTTTVVIPGDLQVTGTTTTNNVETVSTSNGVVFEGNAADDHEVTLLAGTVTADRTATLPDKTGTIAMTSDLVANEKITKLLSGDGTNTTYTITHGFGTNLVMTQVLHYGNAGTGATYDVVQVEVQAGSNNNTIDVIFGTAPTTSEDYLVLVSKFPAAS